MKAAKVIGIIFLSIVVIIGLQINSFISKVKHEREVRQQETVQAMGVYLQEKYNEEFECIDTYSFMPAGSLQSAFATTWQPIGEKELALTCSDNGSDGFSDGFLIVLGRREMDGLAREICEQIFVDGEKYLVYGEAIPNTKQTWKYRPKINDFIEEQKNGERVSFNVVVSLYGDYKEKFVKEKVCEIGNKMKEKGIKRDGCIVVKVYSDDEEFTADEGMHDDREGLIYKAIIDEEYEDDFKSEDVFIGSRFIK